jgi:hypothetical protein
MMLRLTSGQEPQCQTLHAAALLISADKYLPFEYYCRIMHTRHPGPMPHFAEYAWDPAGMTKAMDASDSVGCHCKIVGSACSGNGLPPRALRHVPRNMLAVAAYTNHMLAVAAYTNHMLAVAAYTHHMLAVAAHQLCA